MTYRIDRARQRGVLFFELEPPVDFDPLATSPRNEVWRRAMAAGHVDKEDFLEGFCCPDAKPSGPVIRLSV